MTEQYVIVIDTVCDGWQAWGESCGEIEVYDSEAEAQAEIDDAFKELRQNQIDSDMEPDEEPAEFVVPLSEWVNKFMQGRRAIWRAN